MRIADKIMFTVPGVLLALSARGQVNVADKLETSVTKVYTIVDQMPEFPGGEVALYQYLKDEVRYPPAAADAGVSGTVYTTFIIQADGSLKEHRVLRGVNEWLDAEAMRVVTSMPRWTPGRYQGQVCCVQFNLPIKFTLIEPTKELTIDSMPQFPGGESALFHYLGENVRYPAAAEDEGVGGVVGVTFVIELDGSLTEVKVVEGVRPDIDREALRVIKAMPTWRPAICQGAPCRSQFNLPVRFTIR